VVKAKSQILFLENLRGIVPPAGTDLQALSARWGEAAHGLIVI